MITLEINQDLAREEFRLSNRVIKTLESKLNELIDQIPDGVLCVSYVSDAEIQRLNRMYRNKDSVTDVLSFSYFEDASHGENLGDIIISIAQAVRQAQDDDVELELVDLITHGVLHVLGHDHEKPEEAKIMFSLQDSIVAHIL